MTLIVAMANDDLGFVVGDTVLSPLLEVKGNPVGPVNGEFHGLKIQIFERRDSNRVCVVERVGYRFEHHR